MNNKNYIPEWKLQRYLLSELPPQELEAIRVQERSDNELRERIDALRAAHTEIKAKYPAAWMARKAQTVIAQRGLRTGRPANTRGLPFTRTALPVLACAALIIALPIYISSINKPALVSEDEDVSKERVKGVEVDAPVLQVWRKTGNSPERLTPDAVARTGDVVQLWYVVPSSCYGALVSVDGRGVLTEHLSGSDGKAVLLTPGRPISLQSSYQLDDAPKYEAFYLITSLDKFDLDSVKKTLLDAKHPIAGAQSLPLQEKRVTAFTLRKPGERDI
jgi:hypothetical protein